MAALYNEQCSCSVTREQVDTSLTRLLIYAAEWCRANITHNHCTVQSAISLRIDAPCNASFDDVKQAVAAVSAHLASPRHCNSWTGCLGQLSLLCRVIFSLTNDIPYTSALYVANIPTLADAGNNFHVNFSSLYSIPAPVSTPYFPHSATPIYSLVRSRRRQRSNAST